MTLRRAAKVINDSFRTENRDGWQQFQLWDLMEIFGPAMGMGRPVPFVGNQIMLTDPEAVPCAG